MQRALRIWLITTGEPLPVDGENERLFRTGILARLLALRGHEVVWWTAAFDHARKRQRHAADQVWRSPEGYELRMLWSPGYDRAVSVRRIVDHRYIGRSFERRIHASDERPDIIVASWPLLELCRAAVDAGGKWGVPVILDVRDLWPDIFLNVAPRFLRPLARLALSPMFTNTRRTFAAATAVTGINDDFVRWGLAYGAERPRALPSFPLGYPRLPENAVELAAGRAFWAERGVGTNPDTAVVCFFGVFGRTLDLDTVILAAPKLRGANIQLVLCGTGERFEELRQRMEGLPHVVIPGWVDGGKIRALMRLASAGLAPYRNTIDFQSSIPNKAVEYLAGGLPIITCLTGRLEALVRERNCGVTYTAGEPDSLVAAVTRITSDATVRRALSENATRVFRESFDADEVYAAYANCIEELARKNRIGEADDHVR